MFRWYNRLLVWFQMVWYWLVILVFVALAALIWGWLRPPRRVEAVEKVIQQTVVVEEKLVTATPLPATPTRTATPAPTRTQVPPTQTPTSAPAGASSIAPTNVSGVPCRDGEVIGNMYANIPRIPVGTAENNVVLELSWPGKGFGGYDRAVVVVPQLQPDVQVFVNNASTIHMVRYCGVLTRVEAYVGDKATHVGAMVVTAANRQGQVPKGSEIGVWSLDILTGTLRSLVLAPDGPLTDTVKSHIEVVKLAITPAAPMATPTRTATVTPTASLTTTVTAATVAKCMPSTIDGLGPWEAKDRTIIGPAVVNIGFPREGNSQVRVLVPKGKTVEFIAAAGSGWAYANCSDVQVQAELTANAAGLPVVKVDDLIAQGKAKWQ